MGNLWIEREQIINRLNFINLANLFGTFMELLLEHFNNFWIRFKLVTVQTYPITHNKVSVQSVQNL